MEENQIKLGKERQNYNYWPLAALIIVTSLGAGAITWHLNVGFMGWMHYFMGFFLSSFAMLKLFNPHKFAEGFAMYDLIAKRVRAYGYVYPLIELGLGLAYLAFFKPQLVYIITIVVMLLSAVGVMLALKRGLNTRCACMGNVLNVPLSTVTLTEDVAMLAMAAVMLLA